MACTDEKPVRTVMIPIDASKQCENVFDWYVKNVRKAGDKLLLFHCQNPPVIPIVPSAVGSEQYRKEREQKEAQLKDLEEKYKSKCNEYKISARIKVQYGQCAGEKICDLSEEEAVDLIVMGSRGLGVIRRTIMGSNSSYVLHHSQIPVVIVPKQK